MYSARAQPAGSFVSLGSSLKSCYRNKSHTAASASVGDWPAEEPTRHPLGRLVTLGSVVSPEAGGCEKEDHWRAQS